MKGNKNKKGKSAPHCNEKQNYNALNDKHMKIRENIEKNNNNNALKKINDGGFNKILELNSNIVIRENKENDKQYDKDFYFNTLFIQSLLNICGETIITIGKYRDDKESNNLLYMDKADGSVEDLYNSYYAHADISLLKHFLEYFNTDYNKQSVNSYYEKKNIETNLSKDIDFYTKRQIDDKSSTWIAENFKPITRHFCKIFLFQMFDRKDQNLLFYKNENKKTYIEIDFDNTNDYKCIFSSPNDEKNLAVLKSRKLQVMKSLVNRYDFFVKQISKNANLKILWDDIYLKQSMNYTITKNKLEKLIRDIAKKSDYFGLSGEEIIDGIKNKINDFKSILEDENIVDILKKVNLKKAMNETLKTLEHFNIDEVEKIVNLELFKKLILLTKTKPYPYIDDTKHGEKKIINNTWQYFNSKSNQKQDEIQNNDKNNTRKIKMLNFFKTSYNKKSNQKQDEIQNNDKNNKLKIKMLKKMLNLKTSYNKKSNQKQDEIQNNDKNNTRKIKMLNFSSKYKKELCTDREEEQLNTGTIIIKKIYINRKDQVNNNKQSDNNLKKIETKETKNNIKK